MVRFIEEDDEAMKTYGAGVRVCVCVCVGPGGYVER